jgi:hypothetical protein
MSTAFRRRAVVVCLVGAVGPLIGPAPPVKAQGGERRIILVNVLDKDGNTVPGLTAANFRGEFLGQPVKVISAAVDPTPRRVALIVPAVQDRLDQLGVEKNYGSASGAP